MPECQAGGRQTQLHVEKACLLQCDHTLCDLCKYESSENTHIHTLVRMWKMIITWEIAKLKSIKKQMWHVAVQRLKIPHSCLPTHVRFYVDLCTNFQWQILLNYYFFFFSYVVYMYIFIKMCGYEKSTWTCCEKISTLTRICI